MWKAVSNWRPVSSNVPFSPHLVPAQRLADKNRIAKQTAGDSPFSMYHNPHLPLLPPICYGRDRPQSPPILREMPRLGQRGGHKDGIADNALELFDGVPVDFTGGGFCSWPRTR